MPKDEMPPRSGKLHRCSFCGKTQDQVKRLVAGPNVFICNECIELCEEILGDEDMMEDEAPSWKTCQPLLK